MCWLRTSTVTFQLDGQRKPFEPALDVSFAEASQFPSVLPIRGSCTTTIQRVLGASGLEMVLSLLCVKQRRPGQSISAICSLLLAEKEVAKIK